MTARLAQIRRYPIKGIGTEPLDTVTLAPEAPMPHDRAWALRHMGAADVAGWQARGNFLVVANGPKPAQIRARTDDAGRIALSHPDTGALMIDGKMEDDASVKQCHVVVALARSLASRDPELAELYGYSS